MWFPDRFRLRVPFRYPCALVLAGVAIRVSRPVAEISRVTTIAPRSRPPPNFEYSCGDSGSRSSAPGAPCASTHRHSRRAAAPIRGRRPRVPRPLPPASAENSSAPLPGAREGSVRSPPSARASRNSSSDSFSSNTSSSSSGGACCFVVPSLRRPRCRSKYSTRATGSRSVRYASFNCDDRSSERFALVFARAHEIVGMQLPAQLVKLRFERRRIERQFLRKPEKREVIRARRERLNLAARRAKMPAVRRRLATPAFRRRDGFRSCLRHTHSSR